MDGFSLKHTPINFMGGSIQYCLEQWKLITSDPCLLNWISGISIDLDSTVVQHSVPSPILFSKTETQFIRQEIQTLLAENVIERAVHCQGEFISNIFLRPKKDGSFRMILNLRQLNKAVEYHHFKMDTLKHAITLMTPQCWFGSVDLKQAYYSVNLVDRILCRFVFDGDLYQFTCLPNGLSEAPRKFTKIMKVIYSTLRKMGHANVGYIDDSILQGDTYSDCDQNIRDTVILMDDLGFTVHPVKSVLVPTQIIVFLGFLLNSIDMTVKLTPEKCTKLRENCNRVLKAKRLTIRQLAELVGRMVACEPGVQHAPLFYKRLELAKNRALQQCCGDFDAHLHLTQVMQSDIQWWIDSVDLAYRPVHTPDPDHFVRSDSSDYGWGCAFNGASTGGQWSEGEAAEHINFKELKAAFLALQTYCKDMDRVHICLELDNTTAVAYIANMGGKKPRYNELAREMWLWAKRRHIWLSARHLPGVLNVCADRESRRKYDEELEWMLNTVVFNKVNALLGPVSVDLFASRLNNQVKCYVSWRPDPQAVAVDAFMLNWSCFHLGYLFPPFSLIGRILQKIEQDKARVILIAPTWATQPWFPKILRLSTAVPRLLPCCQRLLHLPCNTIKIHPLHKKLRLAAFKLSGIISECKEFQRGLPPSSLHLGDNPHSDNTTRTSLSGYNFVVAGKRIHLLPL